MIAFLALAIQGLLPQELYRLFNDLETKFVVLMPRDE